MATIVADCENGTPPAAFTIANDAGISVIAFSEQQLDDALRTLYIMHDTRQNTDGRGHETQQQQIRRKPGHRVSPRVPTRLETGIRLFSTVPASKVVDFFIALLRHARIANANLREDEPTTAYFGDGLGAEHVLVQSFFVWLENTEKRNRKGLPFSTAATPNAPATTAASPSSTSAAAKVRRATSDCDGFRPSQRTPTPPRKGGGRAKHQRHRAVTEEQQHQTQLRWEKGAMVDQQQQTEFANNDEDGKQHKRKEQQQSTHLETMSDKLRKILCENEQQHDEQDGQKQGDEQTQQQKQIEDNTVANYAGHGEEGAVHIAENSVTTVSPQLPCIYRVLITSFHRDQLVTLLAPLSFSPRTHSNIWKTVVSVLELKHAKYLTSFVTIVKEMVHQGQIGFDLLNFCLQHFADKMNFNAQHLVHALLLGPLCAATVEQFAANQSDDFRAQSRAVLLEAESWKYDENKWRAASIAYAYRTHEQLPEFKVFCYNVNTLMNELKHEMSDHDNLVNPRWAHSLIKTAARKLYTERTWKEEHFNDLVHTVLVQQPTLKAFLLNVLLKDHHDKRAHEKWRNFVSTERCRMSNTFDMVNLCSKDEQTQFLSLPRRCAVYEIDTAHAFRVFERQLDEYFLKKTHRVLVGVDAEWNPYVARSRASLLQLALVNSVYLLDLDALYADKSFQQFIDRLFLDKAIIKLGYQFGDDLAMLRARLPACVGLYRPQGIVCIGQLVDELNRLSLPRLPDFPLHKFLLPLTEQQEEELKEHTRQIKPQRYDAVVTNSSNNKLPVMDAEQKQQGTGTSSTCYDPYDAEVELFGGHDAQGKIRRASKKKSHTPASVCVKSLADQGLAYLCRRVLGKPLDKQEQCSVWDRRPLRRRQIRYAALDAHCLMQIHHRCAEWSDQLGLGTDPIALMSSAVSSHKFYAPLPLFCFFSVPKELLLTTTNATDGKVWGNEEDEPEGWSGN
ncbi:hypothetical protein niasHT_025039 [Heterodera trifolii]|uniref:3'-5' exonuclease domain-containing protein n=1 Tax=Heterodera trifolii TaxID=157864 RepID=A0ABD2KKS5_9BILA